MELFSYWDKQGVEQFQQLNRNHFVVLDIETTGLSPQKGARIIEVAALRVVNGEIVDRFEYLVNPNLTIPRKITELTSITNEMVKGAPFIEQVLADLKVFIQDAVIVGHNIDFDWNRFLLPAFEKVGYYPQNEVLCTLKVFKKAEPSRSGKGAYKLSTLCALMGFEIKDHHRAMPDVEANTKALLAIQNYYFPNREPITWSKSDVPHIVATPHTAIQVKTVRYWQKKVGNILYERLYVNISTDYYAGTVFYDLVKHCWGNKDFSEPLDFTIVEQDVLTFIHATSKDDLYAYRK